MRIDQWTQFVDSLAGDPEARAIFSGGDAKKIVALAQAKGFSFTEQDVAEARIDEEVSENQLEGVSGGAHIGLF